MSVTIASVDELQFGDLGDVIVDELEKRLGYMKDRDAKYLQRFVQLLEDSGISGSLATKGSSGTKSLVGRTLGRRGQLDAYTDRGPAPDWLWKQTMNDVIDVVKAAQDAGMDVKGYSDATIGVIKASVPTSSPAPVATVSPTGAASKVASKAGAPLTVKEAKAAAVEAPYYAAHATDLVLPDSEKPSKVWKTVKEYALPIGILGVGLVGAVVIAVLERRKRPQGTAGLAGLSSKGCRSVQKRWLRAEKRAHRAKASGHVRTYRKAEKASEKAYESGQRGGCGWAR